MPCRASLHTVDLVLQRGDSLLEDFGRGAGIDRAHGDHRRGVSSTARWAARASTRPRAPGRSRGTAAKMGRSMKAGEHLDLPFLAGCCGFPEPGAAARVWLRQGAAWQRWRPRRRLHRGTGRAFTMPSTMTRSPGLGRRDDQSSPDQSPLDRARFDHALWLTVKTILVLGPPAPRCGTVRAPRHHRRVPPERTAGPASPPGWEPSRVPLWSRCPVDAHIGELTCRLVCTRCHRHFS